MVPLQAVGAESGQRRLAFGLGGRGEPRTKLLLDDLENFLLVKFLRKTLDRGQSLATITLCVTALAQESLLWRTLQQQRTRDRGSLPKSRGAKGRAGLKTYAGCVYGCNSESV